ncbi:VanZ family protein [Larkinella soli]|uniref:VanZ family protein n=1 Tax=Larkinella soli TaxID=1770527 RepID=UPI000FFC3C20|nr:VanZ family protein [Larkinella soli]
MRLNTLIKWAAIGWTIAIFLGCAWPNDELPEEIVTVNDKFIHASIFAVWAILWGMVYRLPARLFWIGVLYGFGIECYQGIMPINRTFDWFDLLADSLGVLIGVSAVTFFQRRLSRG